MAAKEIRAGRGHVEIFLKDTLAPGLKKAANRLKAWGASITGVGLKMGALGAAVTAPLLLASKMSAEAGAAIFDMSKRTGFSVEALSAMGYAAELTGTSLESFEVGVKRMQKSIAGVKDDVEGTTGSLEELGISAAQIKGQSPEKQFALIAERIRAIKDPTERAAAMMRIFGRSGSDLLPLIDNYETLTARAKELGFVMSTQSATERKAFSDAMIDATRAVKSLWAAIVKPLIPALKRKTEWMMRATLAVREMAKTHGGLIVKVFAVGTALVVTSAALLVFGKAFGVVAIALKGVAKVLPLLATPLGGLVVGIGAGAAAWFLFSRNGKAALSEILDTAQITFKGISDAMAKGDIVLAAQILWAGLKLAWAQGTTALMLRWIEFKAAFVTAAVDAFYGVMRAWTEVSASLQTAWTKAANFFVTLWSGASRDMTDLLFKNEVERLKIGKTDVEKKQIDQDAAEASRAANASDDETGAQRQIALEAKLLKIESDRVAKLAKIGKANEDLAAGTTAAGDEEVKRLEQQRRELLDELNRLRKQASGGGGPTTRSTIDQTAKDGADIAQRQLTARTGFNTRALLSLQGGSAMDRTAKATEQTARNTKNLLNKESEGVFV